MKGWLLAWADALEMRSEYQDGYVAGVVDALTAERGTG